MEEDAYVDESAFFAVDYEYSTLLWAVFLLIVVGFIGSHLAHALNLFDGEVVPLTGPLVAPASLAIALFARSILRFTTYSWYERWRR